MNLSAFVPLLTQAAGPMLSEAMGARKNQNRSGGISALTNPGVEARAGLAEAQMLDPGFWRSPSMNWEQAALVAVIGFMAGHLIGKSLN